MNATHSLQCPCGEISMEISGPPQCQMFCHCEDCRSLHGGGTLGLAIFAAGDFRLTKGVPAAWTLRKVARQHCPTCGTRLFAHLPEMGLTMVFATLLPEGMFRPEFHIHCLGAVLPVADALPHYKDMPAVFGGSGECVAW
jgi:hypothetical protein